MIKRVITASAFNKTHFSFIRLFSQQEASLPFKNENKSQPFEKDNHIIIKEIFDKGVLMLNREEAMNSVTRLMLRRMYSTFMKWENTKGLVIIRPMGNLNLCTGGDLKSYYNAMRKRDENYKRSFGCLMYATCYLLGTYKIPYLSIMHGPTMGFGLGMSVHAKYRIVTDKTVSAMPEPRVGMFTDVSSSYFLPRLKGKLGFFLALTGYKLRGTDCLHAGLATHYVPSDKLESVYKKLLQLEVSEIGQFLDQNYGIATGAFSLAPYLPLIDHCFSQDNILDIIKCLDEDGSEFAKKLVQQMRSTSPTALKISFAALKKGSHKTLEECVKMEYRLIINHSTYYSDFVEGIRAVLIDKDQKPQWSPATLEEVSDNDIENLFKPMPDEFELPTHREILFM